MKIDGKLLRDTIVAQIADLLRGKSVCFFQFGENTISEQFVRQKVVLGGKLGILSHTIIDTDTKSTEDALNKLQELKAHSYDGIVVQLPLPSFLDTEKILAAIPSEKDIDLLNPETFEKFKKGETGMIPPVARAVWKIITDNTISLKEKHIVILGNGKLVGAPIAALFDRENVSYELFDKNSDQEKMKAALLHADIIISGIGKAGFLQPAMVKEGVVLIDAGTSEESGVVKGDIDPDCYEKASLYTPVPGGVGPVTVVSLFQNLI